MSLFNGASKGFVTTQRPNMATDGATRELKSELNTDPEGISRSD
jgi:hypothetical protein